MHSDPLTPPRPPEAPSPEALWERAERRAEAGDARGEAEALREGHLAGWPGFLHGLVSRAPAEASDAELAELAAEPLALSRLTAALALAARGQLAEAVALSRGLVDTPRAEVLAPSSLRGLAGALLRAGHPQVGRQLLDLADAQRHALPPLPWEPAGWASAQDPAAPQAAAPARLRLLDDLRTE